MLNLLALKPDGGFEKYMEYGEAVAPILEGIGGQVAVQRRAAARALIGSDTGGTWSCSSSTRAGRRSWR